MSEVLKSRLGCTVVGVEVMAEEAELAREYCERVIIGDAENMDFEAVFGDERFDVIIFADVLEHLRQPADVLRRVVPLLATGGSIVASIPNVAHGSLRLALLRGEFRYRKTGLLDDTHIRFFTRDTIQELFESSGCLVTHWLRRNIEITMTEITVFPRHVPTEVWGLLEADPEAHTYQFVTRAIPVESAAILHQVRTELSASELEREQLRQRSDAQTEQIEHLTERVLALQAEHDKWYVWIQQLQQEIEQREAQMLDLRQEIEQQRGQLGGLVETIQQQDTQLKTQNDAFEVEIQKRDSHITSQDQRIRELQDEHDKRHTWIQQLQQENEQRGARVLELQDEHDKWYVWIQQLQQEIEQRGARIAELTQMVEQKAANAPRRRFPLG